MEEQGSRVWKIYNAVQAFPIAAGRWMLPEQSVAIPARHVPKVNSKPIRNNSSRALHSKRSSFGELGLNPMSAIARRMRVSNGKLEIPALRFHPSPNNSSAIKRILKREKEERGRNRRANIGKRGRREREKGTWDHLKGDFLVRPSWRGRCTRMLRSNFMKRRHAGVVFKVGQYPADYIPVVDEGGLNIFIRNV